MCVLFCWTFWWFCHFDLICYFFFVRLFLLLLPLLKWLTQQVWEVFLKIVFYTAFEFGETLFSPLAKDHSDGLKLKPFTSEPNNLFCCPIKDNFWGSVWFIFTFGSWSFGNSYFSFALLLTWLWPHARCLTYNYKEQY